MNNKFLSWVLLIVLTTATGVVTAQLTFEDGFEFIPTPLNFFMGTYTFKNTHDLGPAYPRRTSPLDPPRSGDHVDTLVGFFSDLPGFAANIVVEIPDVASNVSDVDAVQALLSTLFTNTISDNAPDFLPGTTVVSSDVRSFLEFPMLIGEFDIPSEPNPMGVVASSTQEYFAVEFEWGFPCVSDPMAVCDPITENIRILTGNPVLDISAVFDLQIVDLVGFDVPPHLLNLPYEVIFAGFLDNFVIPQAFSIPTLDSFGKLFEALLILWIIDLYNNSPTGMMNPINCAVCTCDDAEPAFESLYTDLGGLMADAAIISPHFCSTARVDAIVAIEDAIDGLTFDFGGGIWQTAETCLFRDDDMNLAADGFGVPDCEWNTQLPMVNGDNLNADGKFFSTN